jgi:hypothetical protein
MHCSKSRFYSITSSARASRACGTELPFCVDGRHELAAHRNSNRRTIEKMGRSEGLRLVLSKSHAAGRDHDKYFCGVCVGTALWPELSDVDRERKSSPTPFISPAYP